MNERLKTIFDEGIARANFSERKKTASSLASKAEMRPFDTAKGERMYQFSSYIGPKVFHKNCTPDEALLEMERMLREDFCQMAVRGIRQDRHVTWYGKLKIHAGQTHEAEAVPVVMTHNKKKAHPLPEGEPCDFLIRLGVMLPDGTVVKAKYDKFRQINRYLELVAPVLDSLDSTRPLRIVDFGCGKAYLTFALYYYLTKTLGRQVEMTGLDLKEDVIRFCSDLAKELGYDHLEFRPGDIRSFNSDGSIDMVITLHACDTATDEAIVQAMTWNTKVILTVPCCQHELFSQIKNDSMKLITRHGILKERLSAMITDAIRCQLLEACGYQTNIMEFISMEHTPKNLMIKAIKKGGLSTKALAEFRTFADSWNITPYLERRLIEIGKIPPRK